MTRGMGSWGVVAVVALLVGLSCGHAFALAIGTPFQVNTRTTGYAAYLSNGDFRVGMSADTGDFVFAWSRQRAEAPQSTEVWKRAYNRDGTAKDVADVQLNPGYETGEQANVSLSVRRNGEYAIAWSSEYEDHANVPTTRYREYYANGTTKVSPTALVSSVGTTWPGDGRYRPAIAAFNNADPTDGVLGVVTGTQHNYYGREMQKDGTAATGSINFHSFGWEASARQGVAAADSGNAVIIGGAGHPDDARWRRARYWIYNDATSSYLGGNDGFQAWTTANATGGRSPGHEERARIFKTDVAINSSGQGVFVWMIDGDNDGNDATISLDIAARRFTLSGTTLTFTDATQWTVNQTTAGEQYGPSVDIDEYGNIMFAWESANNMYGRILGGSGSDTGEFRINPTLATATTWYRMPDVALRSLGGGMLEFAVAFSQTNDGGVTPQGASWHVMGVQGQLLPEPATFVLLAAGLAAAIIRRRG